MNEVIVSHRGILRPRRLLQAAERSVAESSGMRQQAGSARAFWKEDVAVLLLTSGIVPPVPPRGSVQSFEWTLLPCSVEVCVWVCALASEACALKLRMTQGYGFVFLYLQSRLCWLRYISACLNLFMLSYLRLPPFPATSVPWRCFCSFLAAFNTDVVVTLVGKTGFPLIIWKHLGTRRRQRMFVLEGGQP